LSRIQSQIEQRTDEHIATDPAEKVQVQSLHARFPANQQQV
jgi:hypothetical protein